MITQILVWSCEGGSVVMKSMDKSSHTCSGLGMGCSKPDCLAGTYLFFWQIMQLLMNALASVCSPGQLNEAWILANVGRRLECPAAGVVWYSLKISCLSPKVLGKNSTPLYSNTPFR